MNPSTTLRSLVCLLILFLFAPIPALDAQAYHPFPAGRSLEYAFTQPGSNETWFLAADFDSIRTQGLDTTFYFYRIDRNLIQGEHGTTCSGDEIAFIPPPLILVNQDHYLGQKMHYSPGGVCTFVSSQGDSFLLQSQAVLGNAWAWNSSVNATVDSVVWGMVLGVPDSLKYIGLSTGETWVLSKSFGLVQCTNLLPFPGIAVSPITIQLSLSAIPVLGLGHPLPGYAEVFQFDPGDKFGYEYRQFFYPAIQTNDWEYHIQSLVPGTRFHYQSTRAEFVLTNPGQGPNTTNYYPPAAYSWMFDSAAYAFVDLKPYQTQPYIPSGGPAQVGVHKGTSMNGRILKEYTITGLYDTCAQVLTGNYIIGSQIFGEGIGEVYDYWGDGQTTRTGSLYCYEKGTEAWGTCLDLSGLGTKDPSVFTSLAVYPNPATTRVRVQLGKELTGVQKNIRMIHIDGREVANHSMADNDLSLDLPLDDLAPGLYLIEVEAKGFQVHRQRMVVAK